MSITIFVTSMSKPRRAIRIYMMKKTLFMLAMLTCIFASCSDGGNDEPGNSKPTPETKSEITIDNSLVTNGLSFGEDQGELSVSFTTNTNWTLSIAATTGGATWCRASATSGSKGTANVKFTVTENTDYNDRSVSVTIKAGTVSKTFTITQKGVDALLITTTKYEVPQEGGTIEVEVKANIEYQMMISEGWIAESRSRALGTYKHTFEIAANEELEKREGEIIFRSGDKVETVKVYQTGGALILLSQNECNVSDQGEAIRIDIRSNVEYGVQMPDVDWIVDDYHSYSRGMSSHMLICSVLPNETYDSRSAEIIFYDKNSELKDTLRIVQAQKNAIIISNKYVNLEKEGGTIEVKVNTNVDFDVQIPSDVTWISQADSRALTEKSFYLNVVENAADVSRSANITIAGKDSLLSDTLVVIQQGNKTMLKLACSTDSVELEGWSEGLFGGDGTYMMGKPHGEGGYLITIGNILEEKSAIVFMDEYKQVREVFIDNTIIAFGDNTHGSVDVSILEKGCAEKIEHLTLNDYSHQSRSSNDHSQQVGIINLALNLQGMYDAIDEIGKVKDFSKKGTIMFLLNKTDAIRNTIQALGGPDIFNDTFSLWLGQGMNLVSLVELTVFRAAVSHPAGACVLAYLGLYTNYLDLYDEHIEVYYGNTVAEIENIEFGDNGLNVDLKVSGFDYRYNLECGVIVQRYGNPPPCYSEGVATKQVTKDGVYTFIESDTQKNNIYFCRPFLINKEKASLWKGFIGDMAGPLVRYGKTEVYESDKELRDALIKLYESTNGDNWKRNDNWCSDKSLTEWYGVRRSPYSYENMYVIDLSELGLTGKIDQTFPDNVNIELLVSYNQLTSINVSGSTTLTGLYVTYMKEQLSSLDISGCTALKAIYINDTQLTSLNAANCVSLEGVSLNDDIQLTSLDVSGCTALQRLQCEKNLLSRLDVSGCTSLTYLNSDKNQLTSLDVSSCTSLKELSCDSNQLTSLDVSGCTSLTSLSCSDNQLTSLNVSGCTSLTYLNSGKNQLTSLDVSSCTSLKSFGCSGNQLTSLDVSSCTSLTSLGCGSNQLTSLDVSSCTSLTSLSCSDNQLTSLDASGTAIKEMWAYVFNENPYVSLDFSDCKSLEVFDFQWSRISNLGNPKLYETLKTVNLSGCTSLKKVYTSPITSLDLSSCTSLKELSCGSNQFTSLDVSGCTSLKRLVCSGDQLTSLDVSDCRSLKYLDCKNSKITGVIPDWFSQLDYFYHDARYEYYNVNIGDNTWVTQYKDKGYGWWYPGEPGKLKHSPD